MNKIVLSSLLAIISCSTLASGRINFPVEKPVVGPHDTSRVSVDNIEGGIDFNFSCTIESSDDNVNFQFMVENGGCGTLGGCGDHTLNGQGVGNQMTLPKGTSVLQALNYRHGYGVMSLFFHSLDNDGTVVIQECHADPVSSR